MIIMILGELCNFGAYAFVEAIIVVCSLRAVVSSASTRQQHSVIDTHGRTLRRCLLDSVPLLPQGTVVALRLDLFYSVSTRSVYPCLERSVGTKRVHH